MSSIHFETDESGNIAIRMEAEEQDPMFIPTAALTMRLRADPDVFKEAVKWCLDRELISAPTMQ